MDMTLRNGLAKNSLTFLPYGYKSSEWADITHYQHYLFIFEFLKFYKSPSGSLTGTHDIDQG